MTVHSDTTAGLSVVRYDRDTMNIAALEMESRACPVLNGFMNDYLVLRDQARIK